jgi:DNA-binding SARP family transcriptional activator
LRGGEEIALGRSATLNLLAGLLLSANSVVTGDTLAELAWGEALPAHPQAALHTKISRLRRVLGDGVIETAGEAYCLRVDTGQLDLLRFDSLMSRALAAASDADAAAALDEAIRLWRGDPLTNTDSPALASEAAPRLTERYLAACEQWAQALLRLGRATEVGQRLVPLARAHPFREPIVRLLMLALCHDGRKAEALTAYDGLRRGLSEELGADPGAALQDLHIAILRGTPLEYGRVQADRAQAGSARPRRLGPRPVPGGPAGGPAAEQPATAPRDGGQFTELRIGPLTEIRVALDPFISVLALTTDALGRRRGAPQAWRRRVLASMSPPGAEAILPITAPRYSVTPDCVTPLNPAREIPVRTQVEWLHSVPEDDLLGDIGSVFDAAPPPQWLAALRQPQSWMHAYADAMADAWRSVEPLWTEARPMLEREIRRVGAAAVRGGLDLILDRLHPASQFDNHVLRIRDPEPASFELGNRPLVLVPMLSGIRALICNLDRADTAWIAYPLPGAGQMSCPEVSGRAASDLLGSVMGPVRAQILLAAEQPLTMSRLAGLSRLPPNVLTHHCERLAAAGLVHQEELSDGVWISQTRRGTSMVALFAEVP